MSTFALIGSTLVTGYEQDGEVFTDDEMPELEASDSSDDEDWVPGSVDCQSEAEDEEEHEEENATEKHDSGASAIAGPQHSQRGTPPSFDWEIDPDVPSWDHLRDPTLPEVGVTSSLTPLLFVMFVSGGRHIAEILSYSPPNSGQESRPKLGQAPWLRGQAADRFRKRKVRNFRHTFR